MAVAACFYCHVYSMRNRIDYGLNMKLCVCLGIISLALWVRVYLIERSEALFKVTLVSIGSALLLGLEILDFPPLYRIFDAHSLWHCGTTITTQIYSTHTEQKITEKKEIERKKREIEQPTQLIPRLHAFLVIIIYFQKLKQ